eukprot:Phypoly_transcript_19186.p1 GENE.Phypoly_transcript_19186~~Phypoly_transcript_19186.p1  ORF type:complete len:199 (+),score=7.84 Phypoly_transcript_19186:110-706(+)
MRQHFIAFLCILCCCQVGAQYLVTSGFANAGCTEAPVVFQLSTMATCAFDSIANYSTIIKQTSPHEVDFYTYRDADCVELESTFSISLGECTGQAGSIYSSFSVSSTPTVNLQGPALQIAEYSACTDETPYTWEIFSSYYCYEGNNATNSFSFPTCTASTYTMRVWNNTIACSGTYTDVVLPTVTCNSLLEGYSCYGI